MEGFIFLLKKKKEIRGGSAWREAWEVSDMMVIDLVAGYKDVFSLWKFNELYTCDLCTFMYML